MRRAVQNALADLLTRLRDRLGSEFRSAILYGSQARGNAKPDSDVDVAVIVRDRTAPTWDEITSVAADVSLDHDLTISVLILSEERWEGMRTDRQPLAVNVETEGLLLWAAR